MPTPTPTTPFDEEHPVFVDFEQGTGDVGAGFVLGVHQRLGNGGSHAISPYTDYDPNLTLSYFTLPPPYRR